MDKKQLLKKYRARLVRSGLVSALGYGLMIGAGANFLAALACWLFEFEKGLWLSIGIGLAVLLVSTAILYVCRFRPTQKSVVHRVDRMGLEERTVTMMELENDDSYIAQLQREDARRRVANVSREQIKTTFPLFTFKVGAVVAMVVCLVFGAGMTAVVGLTDSGVLPPPGILDGGQSKENFVSVSYLVEIGGEIEGEAEQMILRGENSVAVVAVAEDGWEFKEWSDGLKSPERHERNVNADFTVTAIFNELLHGDGVGDGDGDFSEGEPGEGDAAKDQPDNEDGSGVNGGEGDGGEGDGNGNSGEGAGEGTGGQEGEGKGDGQGNGAGGGWKDADQIIDGMTNYRDVYDIYYDMAMELLSKGEELPPDLKAFIEGYYGSI